MMVFLLPVSDLPVSLKASEPGIGIKKPNASGRVRGTTLIQMCHYHVIPLLWKWCLSGMQTEKCVVNVL